MKIKHKITFFVSFIIFLSGCSSIPPLTKSQDENYSSTKFLDDNHFQIVLKSKPLVKNKGLVAARESAIASARNEIQSYVVNQLLDYYIKENNLSNSIKNNKILYDKFYKILLHGKIKTEYYDKYNYAYIVYRIKKKNLRNFIKNLK